jgi:superfamily II DNA or RNA helicase
LAQIETALATLNQAQGTRLSLLVFVVLGQLGGDGAWQKLALEERRMHAVSRPLTRADLHAELALFEASGLVADGRLRQNVLGPALRWVARRSDLPRLVGLLGMRRYGIEPLLALVRGAPVDRSPSTDGAAPEVAAALLAPLDAAWLDGLPLPERDALIELALPMLEEGTHAVGELPRHLAADPGWVTRASHAARRAVANLALMQGDRVALEKLAFAHELRAKTTKDDQHTRTLLDLGLALLDGRFPAARAAALRLPQLPFRGLLPRLASLACTLGDGRAEPALESDEWERVHTRLQPRRRSWLDLAADASDPHPELIVDWRMFVSGIAPRVERRALVEVHGACASFDARGFQWLAEQTRLIIEARLGDAAPVRARTTAFPSLNGLCNPTPAWERSLTKLELLASTLPTSSGAAHEPPATAERILWRVHPRSGYIEPHLQKMRANGSYTAGRKLAPQHLLPHSPQLERLPPEDLAVARWARDNVYIFSGYPRHEYSFEHAAWDALVGHPRVYLEDELHPREVVAGRPRVVLSLVGDELAVCVEPERLKPNLDVRSTDRGLVVYRVPEVLAKLAADLTLRVPRSASDRVQALVARLLPTFDVESGLASDAKLVPADATPIVRLVPNREGFSASLLMRPLGYEGATVSPGVGQTRLLGQVGGERVQTERDLAEERRRAADVRACFELPSVDAEPGGTAQTDEVGAWHVDDVVACLALVARLRELGDRVRVEWPHGKPLTLRPRADRSNFRGSLSSVGSFFELDAKLEIERADGLGELEALQLDVLLQLIAESPGRFVKLGDDDYLELEEGLRETLVALAGSGLPSKGKVGLRRSSLAALESVSKSQVELDVGARAWKTQVDEVFAKMPPIPRGLVAELRDYQVDGYRWLVRLASLGFGACLADDMGLGKTVQLVALLLQRATQGPQLVVAPTSVCENWRRELERFAPSLRVLTHTTASRYDSLEGVKKKDVVLTSYTILLQDQELFEAIEWTTAILDEAQLIKNAESQRAKAAFSLRAAARVIATGTPVENRLGDLLSLFRFLEPGLLEGPNPELRVRAGAVRPFILRRTKAQVLADLPPITEVDRTVVLSAAEAKLYDGLRKAALKKLQEAGATTQGRFQVLAELTRLRRLCCHPVLVAPESNLGSSKLESFLELVDELVAADHRALVFSQFTDVLALAGAALRARGVTFQYLDGSTPTKKRSQAVDAFQAGEGQLFLISLKAGGFGLNLTGADYVVHLDPWWNPAVEAQATDRAHRIGQTRPVTVYRLVAAGTIESRIVELHREKRELADALLEGTDQAARMSASELRALLT